METWQNKQWSPHDLHKPPFVVVNKSLIGFHNVSWLNASHSPHRHSYDIKWLGWYYWVCVALKMQLLPSSTQMWRSGHETWWNSVQRWSSNSEKKSTLWNRVLKSSGIIVSISTSGLNIICFIKPEEALYCLKSSWGVIPGYCMTKWLSVL